MTLGAEDAAAVQPEGEGQGARLVGQIAPSAGPHDTEPVDPTEELLTRRQAAERFGLDPQVLTDWERSGILTPRRKTPRGQVHYATVELKVAVSENEPRSTAGPAPGLVLSAEQLWTMVEEARAIASQAQVRASAAEAEARVLREMLERLQPGALAAPPTSKAAEQARRWASEWEQHERGQQP